MNTRKNLVFASMAAIALSACTGSDKPGKTLSGLTPEKFETVTNNIQTRLFKLKNSTGMEVCVTNFGGRIVSVMVPDRSGNLQDVVLGFDNIDDYINVPSDFGASIGRYANRIKDGRFSIDGQEIQLPQNNFGHCLHGGPQGWQYQAYSAKQVNDTELELVMNSPDGDMSFPGNMVAKVVYRLTDDNAIDISYEATSDKKTIVNMTNHSYFNLSGKHNQPITEHSLFVNSSEYTPVDSTFMTTGEILSVAGTPMDFSTARPVGARINNYDFEQLKNGNGYDHNWVLETKGDITQVAATLYSPESGIRMDVFTNEPGIQVYSGNFLDGTVTGKNGIVYNQRAAICLETQHYPDSPNKPEWPSVVLNPGETYSSRCIFRFSVGE